MRRLPAFVLAMMIARSAAADSPAPAPAAQRTISPARRTAAIAAAVFPGIVVRGLGSWIVGEKRAAKRLLVTAAGGAAAAGIGGAFIGGTGGSPYVVWPEIPLVLVGAGAFLTSWFADIYVAAGGTDVDAHPRALPPWSVHTAFTWQHDSYRERAYAGAGGRVELGRIGLGASALVDVRGDAAIGDADLRVRILGAPPTGEVITCGNRLVARVAARIHHDAPDDVSQLVGEVEVFGRYDLDNLDSGLGPSFVEMWTGLGALRATYASTSHDWSSILPGGFAWGAYLGTRGEAKVFYEHRRDGIVGGIAAWRAAGFVGSVGGSIDLIVSGPWTVQAELAIGNAWVTTLGIGYRGGAR